MTRATQRGLTLLEVMVSLAILAMISLLIYGAFDALSRGKRTEMMRADRTRQGRQAMFRISRELSSAYLSDHQPLNTSLVARVTAFIGKKGRHFDRVDFTSFAYRRIERNAKASDQAQIGYFVVKDRDHPGKMDLVRREKTPLDKEPMRGGSIEVLAEDVELFKLRYLDAVTGSWIESWDSTQVVAQQKRLPFEVQITLNMKGVEEGKPWSYTTKVRIPIQQPLSFGKAR